MGANNRPRSRTACSPIFSETDADLCALRWRLHNGYPISTFRINRTAKPLCAHRVVMQRVAGRKLLRDELCDHINGDRLDNRRENLRIVTHAGNSQNRRSRSGFRGASFRKAIGKWIANVHFKRRQIYLGCYATQQEAAEAAAAKRKELGFLDDSPVSQLSIGGA